MSSRGPLHKRKNIVYWLRRGAVPSQGLELFAVGLDHLASAMDEELEHAATSGAFKAVRGEYGSGKTFFASWLVHRALSQGFATSIVQVAQGTPLYRMETVYRQMLENMQTREHERGAFKQLVDGWFYAIEEEVLEEGGLDPEDAPALAKAVGRRLEERLSAVSHEQPEFAVALRGMYLARLEGDVSTADNLLGWLMAKETAGAAAKRKADLSGAIGHRTAGGFLRGLLALLRQTGRRGMLLVLDEVETLMRVRHDQRKNSLEALRKLLDDLAKEQYPGLMVLITGTPAFFKSLKSDLPALHMRLDVAFDAADAAFDNPLAVQIRLRPFDKERLLEVGQKVRALYPTADPEALARRVPDAFLAALGDSIAGELGGKVGLAPRVYLKALVDVLDRTETNERFDPAAHYRVDLSALSLTAAERAAAGVERSAADVGAEIDLDLEDGDPDDGGIE